MIEKSSLQVEGMTCAHCVEVVEENVNRIPGVARAIVDLEAGNVEIEYNSSIVGLKRITAMIEDKGYKVTG